MGQFTCELCHYKAGSGLAFQLHCVQAHFRCIRCQKNFFQKAGIMHHLANVHGEKIKCDHCEFMEYPPSHVIRHELLTHKTCSACGKLHGSISELDKHLTDVHGIEKSSQNLKITDTKNLVVNLKFDDLNSTAKDFPHIKLETGHVLSSSSEDTGTLSSTTNPSNAHFTVKNEIIEEEKEVIEIDDNDDEMAEKANTNEDSKTLQHCNLCDMVMMNQEEMQKHISERRNVLYSCDICAFKACTLDGLIDHKKVSHPTPKKVVIKINPPAKYEGLLRRVQRSSSGAIDHDPVVTNTINEDFDEDIGIIENGNGLLNTKRKCARCSFTAKYPYDIYLHGVNVHKRCTKCNEDFDSKKGVMDHLANVHSERVQCELCDFQGFPAFQLTIHQTLTHKKCNKCEFRFNTTDELQDHMNKSHGTHISNSILHMNTMHSKKSTMVGGFKKSKTKNIVKCDHCDYSGPRGSVKIHMSRIHKGDLHYKYFCEYCDFKTYMKTKILDHAERRLKHDKLSKCEMCDFKSCTWFGLVFHKAKTHGVTKHAKKFKCGYCDATFTLQNNFSNHVQKKHQGEQGKFACTLCDFKTFDKFYLKKHISNHEDKDFPYQRDVGQAVIETTIKPIVTLKPKHSNLHDLPKTSQKKVLSKSRIQPSPALFGISMKGYDPDYQQSSSTMARISTKNNKSNKQSIFNPVLVIKNDDTSSDEDDDYVEDFNSKPDHNNTITFNEGKMITLQVDCTDDDVDVC